MFGYGDINEDLLKTVEELNIKSSQVKSLKTDVSDEEQVKLIDETVNTFGKLDIIVNNVSVAIGNSDYRYVKR